jgi:hypothetical protein
MHIFLVFEMKTMCFFETICHHILVIFRIFLKIYFFLFDGIIVFTKLQKPHSRRECLLDTGSAGSAPNSSFLKLINLTKHSHIFFSKNNVMHTNKSFPVNALLAGSTGNPKINISKIHFVVRCKTNKTFFQNETNK